MLALQFPVFILADAMKFMDVTHAAKPNPKTHVPQATTAHDSFWDYVANNQESAHMVMWLMSDARAAEKLAHDGRLADQHLPFH